MTKCFNRAIYIGYLAKEPDYRVMDSGIALTIASLGVERSYKVKDKNGVVKVPIDFMRLNFWRRIGEIAHQYLHKGDLILVEGEMHCSSFVWEGQRRYSWALDCRMVRFLKTQNADAIGAQYEDQEEFSVDAELGDYDVGTVW